MAGVDGIIDGSFTIKRGQGITQAIRDELGLTAEQNRKLGLSVWTEIMQCVKEENDQREADEKIYTGGSNIRGNWRNNFVVQANQVIALSFATWNKITSIVNNALGTQIVSQVKEPPAKDDTPPTKSTNIPKVSKLTKEELMTAHAEHKNSSVKTADGRIITYDENGYITDEYDQNGNETRGIYRDADGSVKRYYDYEYDQNGNMTREIWRNADGSVDWYRDYDYDQNGNVPREITRNADGSVNYYRDYEYDQNGNILRNIWRDTDGSVMCYWDYEYDQNGNETRSIMRNADGSEVK